jgi:hypothetical protein
MTLREARAVDRVRAVVRLCSCVAARAQLSDHRTNCSRLGRAERGGVLTCSSARSISTRVIDVVALAAVCVVIALGMKHCKCKFSNGEATQTDVERLPKILLIAATAASCRNRNVTLL